MAITVVTITAGTGTDIAVDLVASRNYQAVKLVWGASGTATLVDTGTPMPVVQTGALPAGTAAIGKLAANSGVDIGDVDVTSLPNVTLAAGTNTNEVVGDVAHDAPSAGNPLPLAIEGRHARATATSADGDVTRMVGDRYGRARFIGVELSVVAIQATASGNTELIAAPSAGNKIRLKRVELSNPHASTALTVGVRFGAAGAIFGKAYLPALGGAKVIALGLDCLLGADAELVNVNLSGAGTIECTAYYETVAT